MVASNSLPTVQAAIAAFARPHNCTELLTLWASYGPVFRQQPEVCCSMASKLLSIGEPLLAYDVICEARSQHHSHIRLRQLLALALSRSGAVDEALSVLAALRGEGNEDEETIALLARVQKDIWLSSGRADTRALQQARDLYMRAFGLTNGLWSGINAATLSSVWGGRNAATRIAIQVHDLCEKKLREGGEADDLFWILATLGEASLVTREFDRALHWYNRMRSVGTSRYADLVAVRTNAEILLHSNQEAWNMIAPVFRIPRTAMFVGHMIDAPTRVQPRFPDDLELAVKRSLEERIRSLEIGFGFSSAACGSDILFAEAVLEAGGQIHIVMPYNSDDFRRDSVEFSSEAWGPRFEAVLVRANHVHTASTHKIGDGGLSFQYASRLVTGLATLHARGLKSESIALAVWDGSDVQQTGGTADTIRKWQSAGLKVEIIDLRLLQPSGIVRALDVNGVSEKVEIRRTAAIAAEAPAPRPELRALLFADAVGFSKLDEKQIPLFVEHFLGSVAALVESSCEQPVLKNTWGDGLYFVFDSVGAAGAFALDLRDFVVNTDWVNLGLPPGFGVRIGVHAGPVYRCWDPVLQARNYIGSHVSRTARIEPITPAGQVYASEAFAALAAADNVPSFRCEYVGQTAQAKAYGTYPTYVLQRTQMLLQR